MSNYNFLIKLKIAIKSVKLSTQRRVESSAHKVKSGKWEEQISKVDKRVGWTRGIVQKVEVVAESKSDTWHRGLTGSIRRHRT